MRNLIIEKGILVPYKPNIFEEYLEKKLIEVRLPLNEAVLDCDENFGLMRESARNKKRDTISYHVEYDDVDYYSDMEHNLIIDEKLLKRLSEKPNMISLYCGSACFFVHDANAESQNCVGVDASNWDFKIIGLDKGMPSKSELEEICTLHHFRKIIDEIVKSFASVEYIFGRDK